MVVHLGRGSFWNQGGLSNGLNTPWVLGHLSSMRLKRSGLALRELTKSGFTRHKLPEWTTRVRRLRGHTEKDQDTPHIFQHT